MQNTVLGCYCKLKGRWKKEGVVIEHAVMKNNKKMAAGGERGSAVSTGDPCLGRGGAYVLFFLLPQSFDF